MMACIAQRERRPTRKGAVAAREGGSFSIRLLALVCDTYREGSRCECLRAPLDQLRARELAKAHGHGGPLDGHTHALNRDLHGLLVQRGRRHPRTCEVREVNCFSNGADNDFGFYLFYFYPRHLHAIIIRTSN